MKMKLITLSLVLSLGLSNIKASSSTTTKAVRESVEAAKHVATTVVLLSAGTWLAGRSIGKIEKLNGVFFTNTTKDATGRSAFKEDSKELLEDYRSKIVFSLLGPIVAYGISLSGSRI